MPQQSNIRKIATWVRGAEPTPPIGDYAEPPGKHDRWQLIAFVLSFVIVAIAAFIVVEFHVFNIHVRVPDDELTATARAIATVTATATAP